MPGTYGTHPGHPGYTPHAVPATAVGGCHAACREADIGPEAHIGAIHATNSDPAVRARALIRPFNRIIIAS